MAEVPDQPSTDPNQLRTGVASESGKPGNRLQLSPSTEGRLRMCLDYPLTNIALAASGRRSLG